MIITRTPFRVSFAGGGSDLKEFYARNGFGAVVSASIRSYMYIVIHPYFQDKIRIKYSQTEDVKEVDQIRHPIVRECLRKVKIDKGLEIASFADVPAGTGLGSSSAFTVGLLNALYAFQGQAASKEKLAAEACQIEIDILGEPVGKQDQYAAAFGDLNYIRFNQDETVDVSPIPLSETAREEMEERLRLYYVGGTRSSGQILAEQMANSSREKPFQSLQSMVALADELRQLLSGQKVAQLGAILHQGWVYKRSLAQSISDDHLNRLYDEFLAAGAEGGKLLGAGGTGFLLIYAGDHSRLAAKTGCRMLPFGLDREGTRVIFSD